MRARVGACDLNALETSVRKWIGCMRDGLWVVVISESVYGTDASDSQDLYIALGTT